MILQTMTLPSPANDTGSPPMTRAVSPSLSVELGRRGVFVSLGRLEVYLCCEPEAAWFADREPGGCDLQLWRLHVMIARAPA